MAMLHDLRDKFRHYGRFSNDEIKAIVITILVLSFVIGFNDGAKAFVLSSWLRNFLFVLLIVTASVLIKQFGYRIGALMAGFKPEYQLWWYGIAVSLVITILSRGRVWLLIPGSIMVHHLTIHRLGFFRYGSNVKAISMIALASNLSLVFLGGFFKTLDVWFLSGSNPYIDKLFIFTLAYAAWSLVPIPPLDGSKLFFESRLIYSFVFGCFAGYAILVALGVFSYIFAIVIGIFVWITYYIVFERTAWGGG